MCFFSNKQAIGSGCFPGHVFGSFGSFGAKRVICVYSQPLERWSMDLGGQKTWWLHQKRDVKFLKEAPTYHYNMPKKNASGILNHEIVCLFVCSFYDQRFILSKFLLPQAPTFLTRIFGIDVVCECSLKTQWFCWAVFPRKRCVFSPILTLRFCLAREHAWFLGGIWFGDILMLPDVHRIFILKSFYKRPYRSDFSFAVMFYPPWN